MAFYIFANVSLKQILRNRMGDFPGACLIHSIVVTLFSSSMRAFYWTALATECAVKCLDFYLIGYKMIPW